MNKQKTTPYDLTLNQSFQTKVERNQQKTNIFFFFYIIYLLLFFYLKFLFFFVLFYYQKIRNSNDVRILKNIRIFGQLFSG